MNVRPLRVWHCRPTLEALTLSIQALGDEAAAEAAIT